MTKFTDLKLDARVLKAIAEAGYETPTPIQSPVRDPGVSTRVVPSGADARGAADAATAGDMIEVFPTSPPTGIIAVASEALGRGNG